MKLHFSCLLVLSSVLLTGCGGGGANISGKVTTGGTPVTSGNLTFLPGASTGKPMTAIIGQDGSYTVSGASTGQHKIVFAPASSTEEIALKPGQTARPAPYAGYTVKSPEVELKSGANPLDVELIAPRK